MKYSLDHLSTLFLIAGVSGAGKSSALHILWDLDFFVIDNLPMELLEDFLRASRTTPQRYARTALLLDIDSSSKVDSLKDVLGKLSSKSCRIELIFIDSETEKIINRYNETRRPHPGFDPAQDKTLADAIQRERALLMPIKEVANAVIDTTRFNIHELRRELKLFVGSREPQSLRKVRVNFMSFGYKFGVPSDCDLLMDVRFIPNPYFIEELREKTGLDAEVAQFVDNQKDAQEFLVKFVELITFLLPRYVHEGKSYINIGVGCTGGRHRSVVLAERLISCFDSANYILSAKHRDLHRYSSSTRE